MMTKEVISRDDFLGTKAVERKERKRNKSCFALRLLLHLRTKNLMRAGANLTPREVIG